MLVYTDSVRSGYKCMRGKGVGIHRRGYEVSKMGGRGRSTKEEHNILMADVL